MTRDKKDNDKREEQWQQETREKDDDDKRQEIRTTTTRDKREG